MPIIKQIDQEEKLAKLKRLKEHQDVEFAELGDDDENAILDTLILLPLSTDLIDDMEPYRMRISKRENLKQDSDILINQIRTLSKQRIDEKINMHNSIISEK